MERSTKILMGGALIAAGIGAGGYVASEYLHRRNSAAVAVAPQLTTDPAAPLSTGPQLVTATLTWSNLTGRSLTYVAQGATLVNGTVAGHWWNNANSARQAVDLYMRGETEASQQIARLPGYRLPYVQVEPGAQGQAVLYEMVDVEPGQEWWFWIGSLTTQSDLLAQDTLGSHGSKLPQFQYAVRVQVT